MNTSNLAPNPKIKNLPIISILCFALPHPIPFIPFTNFILLLKQKVPLSYHYKIYCLVLHVFELVQMRSYLM